MGKADAAAKQQVAKLTAVMAIIQAQVNANPVPVLKESIELIELLSGALKDIALQFTPNSYSYTPMTDRLYPANLEATLAKVRAILAQVNSKQASTNSRLPTINSIVTELSIYHAFVAGFNSSTEGHNGEYGSTIESVQARFKTYAKTHLTDEQWAHIKKVHYNG